MLSFSSGGWTVYRRIGVGDRELVRAGLVQIALMQKEQTEDQLASCIRFARKVGRGMRVYMNTARHDPLELQTIIYNTMGKARDFDFMDEGTLTRTYFDWLLNRCDLIIEGGGPREDLTQLLIRVWTETGGRHLLDGACWRQLEEHLKEKFPDMYGGEDRLFRLYTAS